MFVVEFSPALRYLYWRSGEVILISSTKDNLILNPRNTCANTQLIKFIHKEFLNYMYEKRSENQFKNGVH